MLLNENSLEPKLCSNGGNLTRVVRLHSADRHECVTALSEGVGRKVLKLSSLVSSERDARIHIFALRPQLNLSAKVIGEAVEAMNR